MYHHDDSLSACQCYWLNNVPQRMIGYFVEDQFEQGLMLQEEGFKKQAEILINAALQVFQLLTDPVVKKRVGHLTGLPATHNGSESLQHARTDWPVYALSGPSLWRTGRQVSA